MSRTTDEPARPDGLEQACRLIQQMIDDRIEEAETLEAQTPPWPDEEPGSDEGVTGPTPDPFASWSASL